MVEAYIRGLLRPIKAPFGHLRLKMLLDFLDIEKLRLQQFAELQASAAILPVGGSEANRVFNEDLRLYKELLHTEKFFESVARSRAEAEGETFLTSDQQMAVERFLEFEQRDN